jgi:hypothetical protein
MKFKSGADGIHRRLRRCKADEERGYGDEQQANQRGIPLKRENVADGG